MMMGYGRRRYGLAQLRRNNDGKWTARLYVDNKINFGLRRFVRLLGGETDPRLRDFEEALRLGHALDYEGRRYLVRSCVHTEVAAFWIEEVEPGISPICGETVVVGTVEPYYVDTEALDELQNEGQKLEHELMSDGPDFGLVLLSNHPGNDGRKKMLAFLRDESGASAAEYGLILAIVTTGIAGATIALGQNISDAIDTAANCISNQATCPSGPVAPIN